jgi:transcriptional regulator with XRE-family HTH domain
MNTFPEVLSAARVSAGMTRMKLAELVGVEPSHISRIESGERVASAELVIRLANLLGKPGNDWLIAAGYEAIEVQSPRPRRPKSEGVAAAALVAA